MYIIFINETRPVLDVPVDLKTLGIHYISNWNFFFIPLMLSLQNSYYVCLRYLSSFLRSNHITVVSVLSLFFERIY